MRRTRAPRVVTRCVADAYALPAERIVEVGIGSDGTGCLVSFAELAGGELRISIYRASGPVTVSLGKGVQRTMLDG